MRRRRTARSSSPEPVVDHNFLARTADKEQREMAQWKPDLSHKQIIRKVLGWVDYRRRARFWGKKWNQVVFIIRRWPKLSLTKRLMDF